MQNSVIVRFTVFFFPVAAFLMPLMLQAASLIDVKDEDLLVLKNWDYWEDNKPSLRQYLTDIAVEQLDARHAEVQKLKGKRSWQKRIDYARECLQEVFAPMPERTPLNVKITGTGKTPYCRYEKTIFESRPEMYVTCCLYIPKDLQEPRPAVLYVCGHSADGYRSDAYQTVCLNLVKKGFVVLAMDPVGQGERLMYYDPEQKKSRVGGPTTEHSYVGKQCFLTGVSLGSYFVWDMVRAVDYMETREEIDASRIAVTGRSGGGTQSSYMMAYDERIAIGAPECYITSLKRLMQSAGMQDAEQDFYRGIAMGLDHADLLEIRAPKPTLILTTTNDFFNIGGARETVAEAKAAFAALGEPDNLMMVEDDAPHESTPKNREALTAFLRQHFDFPGEIEDEKLELLPKEELFSTETGQIIDSLGGRTVFDYNRDYVKELCADLEEDRKNPSVHLRNVCGKAEELSGYGTAGQSPESPLLIGRIPLDGYVIEKWILPFDRELVIPILLAVPDGAQDAPATMLFLEAGKAAVRERMEKLAHAGHVVLAADLAGAGETDSGNREYQDPFAALWLGIGIPGIRATQISRCMDFIETREYADMEKLSALGEESMATALLHAAVFDKRIKRVVLADDLASYEQIAMNHYYQLNSDSIVSAALTAYDLPDLVAALAPREVLISGAHGHDAFILPEVELRHTLSLAISQFQNNGMLDIDQSPADEVRDRKITEWLLRF